MIDVERELAKHFDAGSLGRERVRFDGAELPLVAPDSIEGFVEAVRFAAKEKLALVPIGLGSKLGWLRPPERADFLLSTRRFTGIVSHVPDDGTIAVRAGTRMSELREITRRGGHFLTPDVPHPDRKTIGGVIAAGESGADRLRFGPVRHHVLGLKVVLADGTVTKCGGQLVKNVTGFDLMRLYTGSHGTLCVIVEAALRLFPEPEQETWITTVVDRERDEAGVALELARRALALPTRTVSLTVSCERFAFQSVSGWHLAARLFGKGDTVAQEREQVSRAWPSADALAGAQARAAAESSRDRPIAAESRRGSYAFCCAPSRLESLLVGALDSIDGAALDGLLVAEPGVATLDHWVGITDASAEPREWTDSAPNMRELAMAHGATLAIRDAPRAALNGNAWPNEDVSGLELMRALKQQLDPHGVFARGRFVGDL